MAKRKKNNDDLGPSNLWKAVKILLLLGVGYGLGWNFGYVSGEEDGRSQARAALSDQLDNASGGQNSSEVSDTDSYGRSPGHPHYGHNHN
jgi:hypothetical protein